MQMANPLEELFCFPVDDVVAALPPEEDPIWDEFSARQSTFKVHSRTRSIAFKWTPVLIDAEEQRVTTLLYAPADLYIAVDACAQKIANHFSGTVLRLMLAELPAGASIPVHCDSGALLEQTHRCHAPIISNPDVRFTIEDTNFFLSPGQVYEVDNMRMHSVSNLGLTRRVHLICNVLPAGRPAHVGNRST